MSQLSEDLLTIGAFSRRSRLTLKALRVYDEMDLLKPAVVDPQNGYRYYRQDQLEPARLIGLLRRLEMPLAEIAEVISLEGSAAAKSIATYWQSVEADVRMKRKLVRYLQGYLSSKGERMFQVETRHVEARDVVSVERRVLVSDLPAFIGEGVHTLMDMITEAGATSGNCFVIYHGEVNNDSDGPVEVCLPFVGAVKPSGVARVRVEPEHDEAFTRITKAQVAFPGILEAFDAVERWVKEEGVEPTDSPREVYFVDWDAAGPEDPACDVALPFKR